MPTRIDPRIETAARVTVVNIADLRQWDRNPHQGDLEEVKASLLRFGQVVPIVRAPDGWIISGNTTLQGMDELGYQQCAVVTLDAEESEQVAWGLASNNIGRKGMDDDAKVLALLTELQVLDGTGYSIEDVEDLTALMSEIQRADVVYGQVDDATGLQATRSMDEREQRYTDAQVRSIILDYQLDTFAWFTDTATALRNSMSVDTNAALVIALMAQAAGTTPP